MRISCTYSAADNLPTADDFLASVVASDLNGDPLTPAIALRINVVVR